MRPAYILIALSASLLVGGCTSMSVEERRAYDRQTCRDYGFKKRNDAFAACMQRQDLDRREQRRANEAALDDFESRFWHRHRYPYYYW